MSQQIPFLRNQFVKILLEIFLRILMIFFKQQWDNTLQISHFLFFFFFNNYGAPFIARHFARYIFY